MGGRLVESCACRVVSKINSRISIFFETSNSPLPLEHGSDRPQTWGKRISDDLQLSIFRRHKKVFVENFRFRKHVFRQKFVFGVEKSKVANRLKRVFPKFEADRSHVRGVNGRPKFVAASAGFAKRKQFTKTSRNFAKTSRSRG